MIGLSRCSDKTSNEIAIIISELRTGYSHLNKYRYNLGHSDSPLCTCGQEETTEHLLLACPQYDIQREIMRHNLQKQLGIHQLTPEVIISMNKPEAEVCNILEILRIFIRHRAFSTFRGPQSLILIMRSQQIVQWSKYRE